MEISDSRARTNEATQREWRQLVFFYTLDGAAREWRLVGSREGLQNFVRLLRHYGSNPKNAGLSEHEHYGPYSYLEIGTWTEPQITDHWIAGPLDSLLALSSTIEKQIATALVGDSIQLRSTFAPDSVYELALEFREADFDPARADPHCW